MVYVKRENVSDQEFWTFVIPPDCVWFLYQLPSRYSKVPNQSTCAAFEQDSSYSEIEFRTTTGKASINQSIK